jgi:chemotaxis signal transduction protein
MNDTLPTAAPANGALPAAALEHTITLVTLQIGRQLYGLPVAVVREIVRLPALTALAGTSAITCGLLNVRGEYVPVLDGCALVGEPSHYDLNSQIVIAGRDKPELGLLVEQVNDVWALAASQILPIGQADCAPFLSGVVERAGSSVLLFDLDALLALRPGKAKRKTKLTMARGVSQARSRAPKGTR